MRVRVGLTSALSLVFAAAGFGQMAGGGIGGSIGAGIVGSRATSTPNTITGSFTTSTMQYAMPAITGAPYSCEMTQQSIQTLADGTHITHDGMMQRMYRDSQGRTRTERQIGGGAGPNAPKGPMMIEIRDSVAGFAYILDTQGKVAHRVKLQTPPGMANMPASRPASTLPPSGPAQVMTTTNVMSDGTQTKMESLGTQTIEGVLAQGQRITTTYPVGVQGNDRPIVTTSENWMSRELGLTLLGKRNDPRSGESTTKVTNLSRVEPDILLFQPPPDYTVVEETGPSVTISYTIPRS